MSDEETDEEDINMHEFQIEQHFDPPHQNNLLCEVAEQATKGSLFFHSNDEVLFASEICRQLALEYRQLHSTEWHHHKF